MCRYRSLAKVLTQSHLVQYLLVTAALASTPQLANHTFWDFEKIVEWAKLMKIKYWLGGKNRRGKRSKIKFKDS
jgi:hypothetical protein